MALEISQIYERAEEVNEMKNGNTCRQLITSNSALFFP